MASGPSQQILERPLLLYGPRYWSQLANEYKNRYKLVYILPQGAVCYNFDTQDTDLMVFNCLHNQAPQYLVDLCQSVSSVASRQHQDSGSASRCLLVVPRHRLSSYGRPAFSVAGPAIWNWLPDGLRDPAISRDSFKHSLNTFLFSTYSCT